VLLRATADKQTTLMAGTLVPMKLMKQQ